MTVKLTILDEVNIKFTNLPITIRRKLSNKFKFFVPYARHTPAYKLGRWDGTETLFSMGGAGYLSHLEPIFEILEEDNINIDEIVDLRQPITLNFTPVTETYWADRGKTWPAEHPHAGQPIMLRDYQVETINLFIDHNQAVIESATGSGKTITTSILAHMCEQYGNTIIIVPNKGLVEQTAEDFKNVDLDFGVYYGDKKELYKTHTICTWQSLNVWDKKSKCSEQDIFTLEEFLKNVKTVIVDEAHQADADVLKKLLTNNLSHAPIRWGLTGTIPKEAIDYAKIVACLGPLIGQVKAKTLQDQGILSTCNVNIMQLIDTHQYKKYQDEIKYLVTDKTRLIYITHLIKDISKSGNTLVLVNRITTGKEIENLMNALNLNAIFISGITKSTNRKSEYDEVKLIDDKIIIATYGVAAVGINILRLFNLVLIEPGKSFVRVIQSIGRGLRKGLDKDHVEIYDIASTCKYSKQHLLTRIQYYKSVGYKYNSTKIDWQTQ